MRNKWTLEKLQEEALKYKTRGEFQNKNKNAYYAAWKRKTLNEICSHMEEPISPWSIEELRLEALKYKTRTEFQRKNKSAYHAVLRLKIVDQVCTHMPKHIVLSGENHPNFKWTLEKLQIEALKYKSRIEFQKKNSKTYLAASRKGYLNKICKHMVMGCNTSSCELSLFDQIKLIYPKTQKLKYSDIKIEQKSQKHRFDLDIYVPELRKGIEFDGKYHHSFEGLKRGRPNWDTEDLKNYHQIKDDYFLSKGIQIIHIKEEDWLKDRQSCIDKCLEFLG